MGDYVHRNPEAYDGEQAVVEAATITANIAAGAAGSNEVNVGENMDLEIKLQVRGTVSGTSPTLDVAVHEADAEGGSYSLLAAFAQQNAAGEWVLKCRTTKPWIAGVVTVGGTTPSFGDTEVFIAS